jgi:bacteriocin-like protein
MTMFKTITTEDLAGVTGGQGYLSQKAGGVAPSSGMSLGMNAMSLLDHPQKTMDGIADIGQSLGVQKNCAPYSVYTPAAMNSSGGITPGSCAPAPSEGPSVPISQ